MVAGAGRTFLFIDLAGFTALTEAHGDEEAATLAMRFLTITKEALGVGSQLVKSIGDAVLIASKDPETGLDVCERILRRIDAEPNFPIPRTGMHHGPAAEREGDFFGSTVNLTARVAAQAHGGQVLGTRVIAEEARRKGCPVVDLGAFTLKNVAEDVRLFDIHIGPRVRNVVIDPVCRMQVNVDDAAGRLRVGGVDHCFCSIRCVARFIQDQYTP